MFPVVIRAAAAAAKVVASTTRVAARGKAALMEKVETAAARAVAIARAHTRAKAHTQEASTAAHKARRTPIAARAKRRATMINNAQTLITRRTISKKETQHHILKKVVIQKTKFDP